MPLSNAHFRGGRSLGVRQDYTFIDHSFKTGSDITQVIAIPTGMSGRVAGVLIYNITESFAGSTGDAGVRVGDGSDDNLYFDSGLILDEAVDTTESIWLPDTDSATTEIPSDEDALTITLVSATGTPAGIANVAVYIDWFDTSGYAGSSVA